MKELGARFFLQCKRGQMPDRAVAGIGEAHLPGPFLGMARNSSLAFQGASFRTVMAAGSAFSRAIIRKSLAVNLAWLSRGRMASSTVIKAILYPSGLAFTTSAMPMAPLAPGFL